MLQQVRTRKSFCSSRQTLNHKRFINIYARFIYDEQRRNAIGRRQPRGCCCCGPRCLQRPIRRCSSLTETGLTSEMVVVLCCISNCTQSWNECHSFERNSKRHSFLKSAIKMTYSWPNGAKSFLKRKFMVFCCILEKIRA